MAFPVPPGTFKPTPAQLGLLSAALPSPVGDAVGLLADGMGYAQDPKSLTLGRGLLSLLSLAPGIPNSAMFLGPLAKTADLSALERAKAMLKLGAKEDEVWKKTGWWVNTPDGIPRFETPKDVITGGRSAEVAEAYPTKYKSILAEKVPSEGSFDGKVIKYSDPSTAAHENMHFVQGEEGMARGGDSRMAFGEVSPEAKRAVEDLNDVLFQHGFKGDLPDSEAISLMDDPYSEVFSWYSDAIKGMDIPESVLGKAWSKMESAMRTGVKSPDTVVRNRFGEAEARAVQNRLGLSESIRKATPPWESFDTPIGLLSR